MNNSGVFISSYNSIRHYLGKKDQQDALFIFILIIISSLLDVFGLASLIPIIMAASNPDEMHANKYLEKLYTYFHFGNETNFILILMLLLFSFFGIKNYFIIWISKKQNIFLANVALKIIDEQYRKYMNLPYLEFNSLGSAKIINSAVYVPTQTVNGIMRPLFTIVSECTIITVILVGIVFFSPVLFLILIVVLVPITFLIYSFLRKKSQLIGNRMNELRPGAHKILTDSFQGYIEIKLADKHNSFREKLLQNQQENQWLEARYSLINQVPIRIVEMIAILGVVIIFSYSLLFAKGSVQLITIIGLFAAAAYRLMPSVNRILTSFISLKQSSFAIEDLSLFREYIYPEHTAQQQQPISFNEKLELRNLEFTFPGADKPTLKNLNLVINQGDKIGLIGSSGSGKTTLLNILLRFITEDKGDILVDGIKLTDDTLKDWYQLIGYVKQETFLMDASIQDNVTLGEINVDKERLQYALEQASLKNFIQSLPAGLETQIGERGSKLSGGQRQRIGIARALYKNSKILFFDEATNALDNATEREVSEAIKKLSNTNITMFLIAHRITSLKNCDRILELRNGEIVAEHKYEELIT